jgi:hypothetical protein
MHDPENPLAYHLRTAAVVAKVLDNAVYATRDAIATLGGQIIALLAQLDAEQRDALGITVEVVVCSAGPIQCDIPGLSIKHLPTIDDAGVERRSGASVLYLDAFHGRPDGVLLKLQSTPGVMVSATSDLENVKSWLEPVCGIVVDDAGAARLVTQESSKEGNITTRLGANAESIVHTFIEALSHDLERRARFNRSADLPKSG